MKSSWSEYIKDIKELLRNGLSKEHRLFARRYARKAKHFIDNAMTGMDKEANETREMADSFFRLLEHKLNLKERSDPPSREEVKAALEQLKDVGRFSIFVTAVVLPGGVVPLIGLELLAKKFGVRNFTLVPSSFRKNKQNLSKAKDETGRTSPTE